MPLLDLPMMRCMAARAELAGQQLRQSASTTLALIASVRWRGPAADAFDENLAILVALVRRTAEDLDRFAETVRRELARTGTRS